jgi:hypothetical protein
LRYSRADFESEFASQSGLLWQRWLPISHLPELVAEWEQGVTDGQMRNAERRARTVAQDRLPHEYKKIMRDTLLFAIGMDPGFDGMDF